MLTRRTLKLQSTLLSVDPDKLTSTLSNNTQQTSLLPKKNIGHWKVPEQTAYFMFLKANKEKFGDREARRTDKIFREMAKAIRTRGADQCRSHHQKMDKKFPEFERLLEYLGENYGQFEEEVLKQREIEEQQRRCSQTETEVVSEKNIQSDVKEESHVFQPEQEQPTCQPFIKLPIEENVQQISLLSLDVIQELDKCVQPVSLFADQLFEDICLVPYF